MRIDVARPSARLLHTSLIIFTCICIILDFQCLFGCQCTSTRGGTVAESWLLVKLQIYGDNFFHYLPLVGQTKTSNYILGQEHMLFFQGQHVAMGDRIEFMLFSIEMNWSKGNSASASDGIEREQWTAWSLSNFIDLLCPVESLDHKSADDQFFKLHLSPK